MEATKQKPNVNNWGHGDWNIWTFTSQKRSDERCYQVAVWEAEIVVFLCYFFHIMDSSLNILVSAAMILIIFFKSVLRVFQLYVSALQSHCSPLLTFLTYSQGKNERSPSPKPGCASITPCSYERLNEESFKPKTEERVRGHWVSATRWLCFISTAYHMSTSISCSPTQYGANKPHQAVELIRQAHL